MPLAPWPCRAQPFLPMLAMLWFWALAVRVFERRRIRYDVCFSPDDQRFLLRSGQLFQASEPPAWVAGLAGGEAWRCPLLRAGAFMLLCGLAWLAWPACAGAVACCLLTLRPRCSCCRSPAPPPRRSATC